MQASWLLIVMNIYCEGFALRRGLFPMHHAWCIDLYGNVIDPTWDSPPENEYFGIPIKNEFFIRSTTETGVWGIFSEHVGSQFKFNNPESFVHKNWLPPEDRIAIFNDIFGNISSKIIDETQNINRSII